MKLIGVACVVVLLTAAPVSGQGGGALPDWSGVDVDAISNRVRDMVRGGRSKDEIAKALVSEFGWDPDGRSMVGSLDGMMAEVGR